MLTTDNCPRALLTDVCLLEKNVDYITMNKDVELIKGKSIIVNNAGKMYLYMGDDHRKDEPEQIIAYDFNGNLYFLGMESKVAIRLKNANLQVI